MDYGTRRTDLAVKRAEWRLSRVYHQAAKDIDSKMKTWEKRHQALEATYRAQLAEGKITQAAFDSWMRGQVFVGEQWNAKKQEIEAVLLNADKAAANIVNNGKIGVFTDNANYMGYELEDHGRLGIGFTMYDQATVARLVEQDRSLLPPSKVQKDKATAYYNKLINQSITQGIIQGETIPQIAKRIAETTGERSYNSAVRNARTAFTGAQNAGRIEGMHQAQGLGIEIKKKWVATLDSRTRDAHADLDGQEQNVDDPFESDLGEIMYPGDHSADPANVYNCRCTLVNVYPEYPSQMQRRDNETGEIVDEMTYREWEAMKAATAAPSQNTAANVAQQATTPPLIHHTIKGKTDMLEHSLSASDYDEVTQMIDSSETVTLYEKYGNSCRSITQKKGAGSYSPGADAVEYGLESRPGMNKYTTMAHEMGHMFDDKIGHHASLHFNELDTINSRCQLSYSSAKTLREVASSSDEFLAAMRSDKQGMRQLLSNTAELTRMKTGIWRNATAGVQDAMDGFFGTQDKYILPWGHGDRYYNRAYNRRFKDRGLEKELKAALTDLGFDASNQAKVKRIARDYETASELWANGVSALTCGGEELDAFETYMPNTISALRKIIGGL